jgi:hypothetical protein
MKIKSARSLLAIGLLAAVPAFAQDAPGPQPGDPARWYQPDVSASDHYRTAMKEAGAAQKEALDECRTQAREAREACMREARERYRGDVEQAKAQTPRPPRSPS